MLRVTAHLPKRQWLALRSLALRRRIWLSSLLTPVLIFSFLDLARCLYRGPARDVFFGVTLVASRISFTAALLAASALALTALWRSQALRAHPAGLAAWLAFILFTANGMAFSSSDTGPASLLPFRILRHQTLTFDEPMHDVAGFTRNQDGAVISRYPIATPLLVTPLYAWSALGGFAEDLVEVRHLAKLAAALLTALAAWWMAGVFWQLAGKRLAFAVVSLGTYVLGTAVLPVHSHALWQHTGAAAALALAMHCLLVQSPAQKRTWLLYGAAIGFAVCARPPLVVTLPGLILAALAREPTSWRAGVRRFALMAVSGGAFALALGLYDQAQFGSFLRTGYGEEAGLFSTPFFTGLSGILVSPGKGLLVFCPILGFCLVGWRAADPDKRVRAWLALAVVSDTCLMAKWWAWDGAWSAGPRMLSDILPLLAVIVMCGVREAIGNHRLRHLAMSAAIYSVLLHCLLTFVMPPPFTRDMVWALRRTAWSIHAYPPVAYVEGGWLWLTRTSLAR